MDDPWISVILATIFLASTSDAPEEAEGRDHFWRYIILAVWLPPVALMVFIYMHVKHKVKPRIYKLVFFYSFLGTITMLYILFQKNLS